MASGIMPRGYPFRVGLRALFEQASFELDSVFGDGPPVTSFTCSSDLGLPQPVAIEDRNPYLVELQRFADCIRGDADPALLDAERAVEALALSLATQKALAEARAIEFKEWRE